MVMSFLTARQRFRTMTFISSEDAKQPGAKTGVNEDVERVRRAHQNDIENIVPFAILGFIYIFTSQPTPRPCSASDCSPGQESCTPLSTSSSSPNPPGPSCSSST